MFLCPECHEESDCEVQHLYKSRGKCERCGKVADCVDCKTYKQEVPTEGTIENLIHLCNIAKASERDTVKRILSIPKIAQGLEAVEKGYNARVDKSVRLPPIKTLPTFKEPTKEITLKVPGWWDDVSLINYLGHINQQNMVEAGFKYKVIE